MYDSFCHVHNTCWREATHVALLTTTWFADAIDIDCLVAEGSVADAAHYRFIPDDTFGSEEYPFI
jgi:hypothetical protein